MPKTVTQVFKLDVNKFEKTGAFDALLDFDTKVFIDPHLLREAKTPEFAKAYETFRDHFANVLKLLTQSKKEGDVFWKAAENLLIFPEVQGICIGYGKEGTAGSGIGPDLRVRLLQTAKQIVDAGIRDPEIFELVGLFEDDIGADRISDMTARIIREHLYAFTKRVFKEFGMDKATNPYNKKEVILIPQEILRPLPVAHDWTDIDIVAAENQALRRGINKIVGRTWRHATTKISKRELKDALLKHPDLIRDLISQYKRKPAEPYDFSKDPLGEVQWHKAAYELAGKLHLALSLPPKPTQEDVLKVVTTICNKFKEAIEVHDLARVLYKEDGKPRHESYAQRIFYTVADAYCEANDLDLSREANAGRGPVDFKVSAGYQGRIIVEIKLSSNKKLVKGFLDQIQEYSKAEKSSAAICVVVDVGTPGKWRQRLGKAANDARTAGRSVPEIIDVDGRIKKSASKI